MTRKGDGHVVESLGVMSEASALTDLYSELSSHAVGQDVEPAGQATERALKNLDHR